MKFFLISLCSVLITILLIGGFFFFTPEREDIYTKKDFVANINGEIISLEDFRERLGLIIKIIKIPYNSKQFDKSKFKEIILQNLIEEKLLLAEVNKMGYLGSSFFQTNYIFFCLNRKPTILVQQHFKTFQQRFKNFPVKVGFLSRFFVC